MLLKLSLYELGELLTTLNEDHDLSVLWKGKLSGGVITLTGKAIVEYYPTEKNTLKGNNILSLRINNNGVEASNIKITSIKNNDFQVEISPTRYKEIKVNSLYINKTKESKTECKIKIDENVIFTVEVPYDEILQILNKKVRSI